MGPLINQAYSLLPIQNINIPKASALPIGLLGFLAVVVIDLVTPPQINLLLLELLPVLFVTWHAGIKWGCALTIAMTVVDVVFRIRNGTWSFSALVYIDIASDFITVLLLVCMQALLKKAYERANRSATYDNLTNTLNRAGFYNVLQVEIDRSRRYAGRPFSLVYFDCDDFKQVNDMLGHHVGDSLLAKIASVASNNLRSIDSICRLGGDEFALLLPECNEQSAYAAMTHLKAELDMAMRANDWAVGFSMGVAVFTESGFGVDKAIETADGLMYEAKKAGKNRIILKTFQKEWH